MTDYVNELKLQLVLSGITVHADMCTPVQLLESGQVVIARVYHFATQLELELQAKLIAEDGNNFKYYQWVPDSGEGTMQLRCAVW